MRDNKVQRVVVLGGGFGGVYVFLELCKRFRHDPHTHITLVSENDRFLFVPMIHEVATGNLLPSSITQSLRTMPCSSESEFVEATVKKIDLDKQRVLFSPKGSESDEVIGYDYLVSALGSETNFFETPGTPDNIFTLKDLQDARVLKNRMIASFEQAKWTESEREKERLLHFLVVGGGPTGVELAGEMADFLKNELDQAFPALCPKAKVTLVQGSDRLLNQAREWFHKHALKILTEMNVEIVFNKRVTKVDERGVYFDDEFLEAATVVWTAGVKANKVELVNEKNIEFEERTERIKVNQFLQIPEYSNTMVIGDQAWIFDREAGQPYPMRAQFAAREGRVAGKNVYCLATGKNLQTFEWRDQGFIVSLGKGGALAEVYGVRFRGFFAWWLYRTAYLLKLVGLRAKIRTAVEWTINLFLPRDVSKL